MKVSDEVRAILEQVKCHEDVMSIAHIGQLDRSLYNALYKVIVEAGGKWSRQRKGFVFSMDAADVADKLILTGYAISGKRLYQQFDTPPDLAVRLIASLCIEPGQRVLEPSMGIGVLAYEARRRGGVVSGYEIDHTRQGLVEFNMQRRYRNENFEGCICGDFLSAEPDASYDCVAMNPPFTRSQDIAHVMHAIEFLKPGGRLAAIVSGSAFERETKAHAAFRDALKAHTYLVQAIDAGAFREAGTMVETAMLTLQKAA